MLSELFQKIDIDAEGSVSWDTFSDFMSTAKVVDPDSSDGNEWALRLWKDPASGQSMASISADHGFLAFGYRPPQLLLVQNLPVDSEEDLAHGGLDKRLFESGHAHSDLVEKVGPHQGAAKPLLFDSPLVPPPCQAVIVRELDRVFTCSRDGTWRSWSATNYTHHRRAKLRLTSAGQVAGPPALSPASGPSATTARARP